MAVLNKLTNQLKGTAPMNVYSTNEWNYFQSMQSDTDKCPSALIENSTVTNDEGTN